MPKNKRRLQWHPRSHVLRNKTRCVVSSRTNGRDNGRVCEAICRTNQAFTTIHGLCNWSRIFLHVCIEFDLYSIGVQSIKKDLNMGKILLALLLNGRGTKAQGPMFRQIGLPSDQIGSQ